MNKPIATARMQQFQSMISEMGAATDATSILGRERRAFLTDQAPTEMFEYSPDGLVFIDSDEPLMITFPGHEEIKMAAQREWLVLDEQNQNEKSPPGFKGTVKAMKKHMPSQKAFALGWDMYKKGAKPHYSNRKPYQKKKESSIGETLVSHVRSQVRNIFGGYLVLETAKITIRLDASKRSKMNKQLDTLTKQPSRQIPLEQISKILGSQGVVMLDDDNTEWNGFLLGREGRATIPLAPTDSKDERGFYSQFSNAMLVLSWYKLKNSYETVCYVS